MSRKSKAEPAAIAVDARGRIMVPLGGANYALRPSHQAIEEIEQQLGRSLIELSFQATRGALSIADQAIIITEMMKAEGRADPKAGPSYSGAKPSRLAELIYEASTPTITARLVVVLTGAVTGDYTAAGEPKPTTT